MKSELKKFIDSFYPRPDKTKYIINNILKDKKYTVKLSSSSKSVIIFLRDSVFKLMKPVDIDEELDIKSKKSDLIEYNKEALPLIFDCKETFVICIKNVLITSDINIIEYEKLYEIKSKYKLRKLLLLMYQVSYALKNIHSKGYYHNDIYLNNIGCRRRDNECDFILFDFELADKFTSEDNKSCEMYRDVKMFLDDLIKVYKDDILYKTFIKNVLNIIEKKSIIETGETKRIFKTIHKVCKNIYNYDYFNKLILKLIKYYTTTSHNISDMVEYTYTL